MSAVSEEQRKLQNADACGFSGDEDQIGGSDGPSNNENEKVDENQENPPNDNLPTPTRKEPPDNGGMVLAAYGYVLGDSLGKGSYAIVRVAFSKKLKRQVAVKIIIKKKAPKDYLTKFLPREIAVMKQLKHPRIIRLHEAIETDSRVYLVLDMADGGDLLDYIRTNGAVVEEEARKFFRQLVEASEYLHKIDVVHRDLKCENILMDRNKNILLSDFGFARTQPVEYGTGKRRLSSTFCGSYAYAPPEILRGIAYDGTRSDVWSLGVVLFTMLCAKLPFDDSNLKLLLEQVSKTVVFPKKRKVSEEAKHLILQMLCEDKKRIDIPGIKKHPWFEGKTFDQCLKENNNQTLVKDKSHDSGLGNDAESISQDG